MSNLQVHEMDWTLDKVADFWDAFADDPLFARQYFSNHSGALFLEYLEQEKGIRWEGRVLNYGCGPGYLVKHLLERGVACEALDFSERSVGRVREQVGANPLFRGATVAHTVPTPLADASVDVLLSVEMVEHLFDEHVFPTFAEFRRLVRPGGTIIVSTPNAEDLSASRILCPDCGSLFHQYQHLRSWTAQQLQTVMEAHGFVTTSCEGTLIAPKPAGGNLRHWLNRLRGVAPPQPHLIYIGRRQQSDAA